MAKISTKNLNPLPQPHLLFSLCKSLATLDAIISPDWESRYYSFYAGWDKSGKESYFQMRDGSGDEFQIVFTSEGAVINGFAHESEMSIWVEKEIKAQGISGMIKSWFGERKTISEQKVWKGVIDNVPEYYRHIIGGEPIKSIGTTFCIWWNSDKRQWQRGNIEFSKDKYGDGSEDLLYILDGNPITYKKWAIEYYEEQFEFEGKNLNLNLVKHIYAFKPVTKEIVLQLNNSLNDFDSLKKDLNEIGFPFEEF